MNNKVSLTINLPSGSTQLLLAHLKAHPYIAEQLGIVSVELVSDNKVEISPSMLMPEKLQKRISIDVSGFGLGYIQVDGQLVRRWDGNLPKLLLYFFVDRGVTSRDEVFQAFWPDLSTREATNVFHVVKRRITEALGANLVVYVDGFYRIADEVDLRYDVSRFQQSIGLATGADEGEAQKMYEVAIDLYRGDFLRGTNMGWVVARREEILMTYVEALVGLARIYERRNEQESALSLYLRALNIIPLREDLARDIMKIYRQMGVYHRALETYSHLAEELRKSLNVNPDPLTAKLAEEISKMV